MASVTVRLFKSYGAPANRQWTNTYELNDGGPVVEAGVSPVTFRTAADSLVAAERQLHVDQIYFNRMTISTWQPDSAPYNPEAEVSVPLGSQGLAVVDTANIPTLEDLRVVCWLARVAATGRPGKLFLRGVLTEADVQNNGGKWAVTSGSNLITRVASYKTALGALIGGTPTGIRMVLIGGTLVKTVVDTTEGGLAHTKIKRTYTSPYHIRNVADIVLQGATTRQTASAYFDRP